MGHMWLRWKPIRANNVFSIHLPVSEENIPNPQAPRDLGLTLIAAPHPSIGRHNLAAQDFLRDIAASQPHPMREAPYFDVTLAEA
jgi:hypothetical protein